MTDLRSDILKFLVVEPPEDVVCRVSGDSKVDRVHQTEARVPDARVAKILNQGVSNPDHLQIEQI